MFAIKNFVAPVQTSFIADAPALNAANLPFDETVSSGVLDEIMVISTLAFFALSTLVVLINA